MTEDEIELHKLHKEVCLGRVDAEEFCNLWFYYCHGIDDLIDNSEDGKPTTSAEKILELFAQAWFVYNNSFYIANRQLLQSCAMTIHNLYADSVVFEKAFEPEKRAIADVNRCCGNEMYFQVALICGGYAHMRNVSPKIRQRSWKLQHDKDAQQF